MTMQPSQLNSLNVPIVGSNNPATIAKAALIPLRVVIRNVGPVLVLLAHDPGTLQNTPVFANAFQLVPNAELTVVLTPQQGVLAVGLGLGGQLSVAISQAIPTKWMEA